MELNMHVYKTYSTINRSKQEISFKQLTRWHSGNVVNTKQSEPEAIPGAMNIHHK